MKVFDILKWFIFIFFAIGVGLYPFGYVISDVLAENGLLSQKPAEIATDSIWYTAFMVHILFGGLSLLLGWSQFSKRIRAKNLGLHRNLGKAYVISVLLSGLAGLYIGIYAEGGLTGKSGFVALAIFWLYTTIMAYTTIRKKQIEAHKQWMIRSYALTFAAVTLRIYLPLFQFGFGMDFLSAYVIIAWLCWVPNLAWAQWYIKRKPVLTI